MYKTKYLCKKPHFQDTITVLYSSTQLQPVTTFLLFCDKHTPDNNLLCAVEDNNDHLEGKREEEVHR